jgi:hypothetical protein
MSRLAHGVDTVILTLWLGDERVETGQVYVHADMSIKERALARTTPPTTTPGRYRPPTHSPPSSTHCRRPSVEIPGLSGLPVLLWGAKAQLNGIRPCKKGQGQKFYGHGSIASGPVSTALEIEAVAFPGSIKAAELPSSSGKSR